MSIFGVSTYFALFTWHKFFMMGMHMDSHSQYIHVHEHCRHDKYLPLKHFHWLTVMIAHVLVHLIAWWSIHSITHAFVCSLVFLRTRLLIYSLDCSRACSLTHLIVNARACLFTWLIAWWPICSIAHALVCSLVCLRTHLLVHSLDCSRAYSLTRLIAHALAFSLDWTVCYTHTHIRYPFVSIYMPFTHVSNACPFACVAIVSHSIEWVRTILNFSR